MLGFRFLVFLGILFAFSSLISYAVDDICPTENPESPIENGELIEGELDEDEADWYFFDAEETNKVWRFDMETEGTLDFSMYNPEDIETETESSVYIMLEDEALSTAVRTTLEGAYCIEIANNSDDELDYKLTVTLLEENNGQLENVEGLDSWGINVVGVYYHNLGEYELALEYYEMAIEQYPDEARFWNNFCRTGLELSPFEEALEYCLEAIELEPDNYLYFYDTAVLYQGLGDYESAEDYFDEALEMDSSNDTGLALSYAINHVFLDNPDEAIDAFNDYVRISDFWFERYWRGLAYLNAGEYEDAIADFEAAIEADEDEPGLYHLWLGIAHLANGNEGEAQEILEDMDREFDANSDELTSLRSRAFYSVFIGRNEEAENYYQSLVALETFSQKRGDLFYLTILSNVFPDEESYQDAMEWLREELGMGN